MPAKSKSDRKNVGKGKKRFMSNKLSIPKNLGLENVITVRRSLSFQRVITTNGWDNVVGLGMSMSFGYGQVNTNTNITGLTAYAWSGGADILSMFDQYMLDRVELTITSCSSTPSAATSLTTINGSLIPLIIGTDLNDVVLPTSKGLVEQISDAKTFVLTDGQSYKKTIRPCYQRLVSFGTATTAFESARGYVDTTYNIQHNGIKIYAFSNNFSGTQNLLFEVVGIFKCKNSN